MLILNALVEGPCDPPIVRRLAASVGVEVGKEVQAGGKSKLDPKVPGLNRAAGLYRQWFVLRDMDHDDKGRGPYALVSELLDGQQLSPYLVLRVAVREAESWLLADAATFATYFEVDRSAVPRDPDGLGDPKLALTNACSGSRDRKIRAGVPPVAGSGRKIGPRYVELVTDYVLYHWRPDEARQTSPSLDRAMARLNERVTAWKTEVAN